MTFWKNSDIPLTIVYIGLGVFLVGFTMMFSGNMFVLGIVNDLPVVAWVEAVGLLICLIGMIGLAITETARNRWLNIVGAFGILTCLGCAVLFGGFPIVEMALGGTGTSMFGLLGFDLEPATVPVIAGFNLVCGAYLIIPFARMYAGLTDWQR